MKNPFYDNFYYGATKLSTVNTIGGSKETEQTFYFLDGSLYLCDNQVNVIKESNLLLLLPYMTEPKP